MNKSIIIFTIFCFSVVFPFSAYSESAPKAKSIEVIGYAELEKGGLISELQRQAIKDALKNALLLTNCTVEYKAVSENLKLKSSSVTYKSSGFVKSSKVLLSEMVEKTSPQLYKVILQVEVVPLSSVAD